MSVSIENLRAKVAISCRILALEELAEETLGHVSVRVPGSDDILIRCRGEDERGLLYTEKEAVRRADFNGRGPDLQGYRIPNEFPIHSEIYRHRPDVGCVVHAHPPTALLCGIAGVEIRPVFGGYSPQGLRLSLSGIPIYDRSITLTSRESVAPLLQVMGDRDVCLLKGHGIVVTGKTVEEATMRAIQVEKLARIAWQLALVGKPVADISPEDVAYFTDSKERRSFDRSDKGKAEMPHELWQWRCYVERLSNIERNNSPLPR